MDANLVIPWSKRLKYLKWSIHYTASGFSMLIGIGQKAVERIERGERPSLYQVRRIRLLERIFSAQIDQFKKDVLKYRSLKHAKYERTKEVYDDYNGTVTRKVTRYFGTPSIPDRPKDIEALGGMALVSRAASIQRKERVITAEGRESMRRNVKRLQDQHRARVAERHAQRDSAEAVEVRSQLVQDSEERSGRPGDD